ncbi:MAG: sigma-70 family RNA polymerase sigma factor [Saccharospirillum sp.]
MTEPNPAAEQWADALELVAKRQDTAAFERLFKHFAPLIKAFALSSGFHKQGDHLPDELVQEVMLAIWRKAASYDRRKAAASTWIFTIARNQRIDMLRRLSKYQSDISADEIWDLEADTELFGEIRQSRVQDQVRSGLYDLPVDQRQVMAKVFLEDKSHQEVADEMGLPLGTVKSRVRLAMKKMKLSLEAYDL